MEWFNFFFLKKLAQGAGCKVQGCFALLLSLLLTVSCNVPAQNSIEIGAMEMDWQWEEDSIWVQLTAPTDGWLAIGFNSKNDIVGADLLMFSVQNKQLITSDQYVTGAGVHPEDQALGGQNNIRLISGNEQGNKTLVRFKIPTKGDSKLDFAHTPDAPFWLILAYSLEDDFEHHSIMRKHQLFKWTL